MLAVIERGSAERAVRYVKGILDGGIFGADVNDIYLRERGLSGAEYCALAREVKEIIGGRASGVRLSVRLAEGIRLSEYGAVQLPYREFVKHAAELKNIYKTVSVHCAEEAVKAARLGADRLITGHIFRASCKSAPPKGIDYLISIVRAVDIPVVAIGGITEGNYKEILRAGASDFAVMNSWQNATKIDIN